MNEQEIREILARYVAGTSTAAEKELVESWFDRYYNQRMQEGPALPDPENLASEVWTRLQAQQTPAPHIRPQYYRYLPYAAILLVALATTLYFYSSLFVNRKSTIVNDIAPGYNQATLTLADGTTVDLDSAKHGIQVRDEDISYNDGTKIGAKGVASAVGSLSANTSHKPGEMLNQVQHDVLLQLSTPKGGQYQVILPDGTKVWLNAASTLKYPSRFLGDRREVSLNGEAYFEIKEDKTKPFKVLSKGQAVSVLGTSFNVAAYEDGGPTKTTLASGAVQVSSNVADHTGPYTLTLKPYTLTLAPGEQSIIQSSGKITKTKVDVNRELAWKNHEFNFNNTPLKDIMRQLERWYNVEVVGIDQLPDKNFYGQMSRDVKLSQVLAMIRETSHLTFTIEGRRLIYQAEK